MKKGGRPVDLLVDTGMTHSVVNPWTFSHREMQPLLGPQEIRLPSLPHIQNIQS
jgi:hypothetical protein